MVGEFNAAGTAEKKGMSQIGQAVHALIEPPPPVGVAITDCRRARVLR
jgi:hypothetical protein